MCKIDTTTLYQLYVEEQRSIRNIALLLHVAPRTVHTAMMHARIPRRKCWEAHAAPVIYPTVRHELNEATLRQLYLIEHRSIREIAALVGTCTATIHHALVKWDIPRRKRGRSRDNNRAASWVETAGM